MIDLAVITGAKAHDVRGFHQLFRSMGGITAYIQHIDDYASASQAEREAYHAVLFFFMMPGGPTDEELPGYCGKPKTALESLGETGQGIIVLHHALLAYPDWGVWDELVGIPDRTLSGYQHDETLEIRVVDRHHTITRGVEDWVMVDEIYQMANTAEDSQVLLQTSHEGSMETLAWVRQYKASRVFCLQLGHDRQAWEDPNFRTVLQRGIIWSCWEGK